MALSEIKKHAKKGEFSDNWTDFLADIKYVTNSYKDERNYIKILNKISVQNQNTTKIVEDILSTSDKKVLESQPSSETNEVYTTSTLSSDAEPVNKGTPEQQDVTDAEEVICQEKMKVGIVDSSPKPRRYLTRQSLRMSSSANNSVILPDQTARDNRSDTNDCVEENDKPNHKQENESSVKSPPELMQKLQILVALRSVFGDDFKEVLKQLHNGFERNHLILENLKLVFIKNCKIIKELIELTDEITNDPDISNLDATVKELEKSMMEVDINEKNSDKLTGSEVQNVAQKKKKEKHNSEGIEVKNNNPLNKIRGQARKFTLPPEYDPNDSRWTLKHRKMKKGLVELVPHSRVYVDAIKLRNCKIMSKNSKTLARMLLLEIFSENALSICSLTGQKANCLEGTSVRPGLDENARTILLKYVERHATEQKWDKFDNLLIFNTLRNKIQDMREKYYEKLSKNI